MDNTPVGRVFPRVLRRFDATLFTVCAILVIDQLAAAASIGTSSIFWWVFTLFLFFIPYALISAELGAAYPEEGGIYAWVRRAYGPRWGARTSWLYWINVALWMPSVYVLFAGMFAQMFAPEMSLWAKIGIGIVLTWVTVYINIISLDVGKWVPNVGAVVKAGIMLSIGIGGVVYAMGHGVANDFSLRAMAPSWEAGLAFLPVIVYNFMGFELMSGASEEMTNPQRDVPRAIIISGLLIAAFYLLATVGILIALPVEDIGLIEGLLDSLHGLFDGYGWGGAFVTMLGIGALFTFVANMVTWTIGANRSASEAADRGDLPAVFGKLHPTHRTPANAAIITGIISTAVIVLYGFLASSAEDLFWTIFAFSSIVFLLPYLLMFGAFLALRRKDASHPRPYRVPGGQGVARLLVALCIVFILQAIVLFIWVPGSQFDLNSGLGIVVGVIATIIVGEVLIQRALSRGESPGKGAP
jgi:amino acid transporter